MVTDDERREVAERLMYEVGCGSSWPGMERLGVILGVEGGPGFPGRFLSRLADLIEPSDHIGDSDKMVDRDALLALAEELSGNILVVPAVYGTYQSGYVAACQDIARRIREACGEEGA